MDILSYLLVAAVAASLGALIAHHLEHSKSVAQLAAYARVDAAMTKVDDLAQAIGAKFKAEFDTLPSRLSTDVKVAEDRASAVIAELNKARSDHAQALATIQQAVAQVTP